VLRHSVFGLGALQVAACGLPLALAAWGLGLDPVPAGVVGAGLALSSTAFVLQLLSERGQLTTHHGRAGFSILLFQDLAVLPLLAAMPLLQGGGAGLSASELLVEALQVAGVLAAIVIGGHYLLRPVLRAVALARTHEIFTATALLVVLGSALAVHAVGLSMALGAFLAGVLLADSEYRHELEANIEPFKGLLLGLFFIAVGMSADLGLVAERPGTVVGLALGLLAVKAVMIYAVARLWGLQPPAARALAVVLPQGGEFAFVLFSAAVGRGILPEGTGDLLIAVVTLSMAATPLLVLLNERWLAPRLDAQAPPAAYDRIDAGEAPVIIAGFGRFGQIVGRLLRMTRIPFTALEINPLQVDFVRRYGNKVYYGDPARPDVLRAAGAGHARAFVLAIDDVEASVRVAERVRHAHPQLPVYARARNRQHAQRLMDLGARVIVRETFDASLSLGRQVLEGLGWAPEAAGDAAARFREHDEQALAKQRALRHDEQALIQSVKQAAAELEELFEYDSGPGRRGRRGEGES
jgi:glutathione-regulated potassium-efflux system ancillary protein KefC/glutathione-regulated potassium-efflux system protein KefB